jgi:predicted nucleic-acid-binding Zn-ribbon protein
MTNGECPKCKGHEIYAIDPRGDQNIIPLDFWGGALLTYLTCTNCGYVETYIFEKNSLVKIAKKGQQIHPR